MVLRADGTLLCVRQKKYAGKSLDDANDYWCLPGGGVDPGEGLEVALHREMVEELGVKPAIGNLLYVQQFVHGDVEHMELFFQITNAADYLDIDLSQTTHGTTEIDQVAFIDPRAERVLPRLLTTEPLFEHAAAAGAPKFFDYLTEL
jgi:ADP-ribose pyrophosphatase YjhB (NUDIX family)